MSATLPTEYYLPTIYCLSPQTASCRETAFPACLFFLLHLICSCTALGQRLQNPTETAAEAVVDFQLRSLCERGHGHLYRTLAFLSTFYK